MRSVVSPRAIGIRRSSSRKAPASAGSTQIAVPGAASAPAGRAVARRAFARAHVDGAAQGIARVHRLDRGQPRGAALRLAGACHAGEAGLVSDDEAARAGRLLEGRIERTIGQDHRVASEQLRRIAHEAGAHAVGE